LDCIYEKFQVLATNGTQIGNHHGVRSQMFFGQQDPDAPDTCQRIAGLSVTRDAGFVEWNWTIGWIKGVDEGGYCGPDTHYHLGTFMWAMWRARVGGPPICSLEHAGPENAYKNMILRDGDEDGDWTYEYEGSVLGTPVMDFNRGKIGTNTERHREQDKMFADYTALRFQVSGSTTWHDFVALRLDSANVDGGTWHCYMPNTNDDTVQQVRQLPLNCIHL